MKGKHWDAEKNQPDEVLLKYLKQKAASVQQRIYAGTGITVQPVYYCAGYKEEGGEQCMPYNLTKLLYYIIKSIPREKRLVFADNLNNDKDMWLHDDEEQDYKSEVKRGFWGTIGDYIFDGVDVGSDIGGDILGIPGTIIGGVLGGTVGAVKGFFKGIFG